MEKLKFSLIVPVRNAQATIRACVEAIFTSDFKDYEVIVVDDASTDGTLDAIKGSSSCRIIGIQTRRGPAYARMAGVKEALGDIVVFIDADIVIAADTLSELASAFAAYPDAVVVVGMLSKNHPNKNFFSVYKNLYMHYIFNRCPSQIDFIYGSFYAIKKTYGNLITVNRTYGEDTELGMRLSQEGHKILLDKKLEVVHLKKYSFLSFVKNDFLVPFYWARLFLREKGWKHLMFKKRFCHSHKEQLTSVMLVPVILTVVFFYPWVAALLVAVQFLLNMRFFAFLYREKGPVLVLCSLIITWFDWIVMSTGIIAGFCTFLSLGEKTMPGDVP